MSKNFFQNIQAFFYNQSNIQPQSSHPLVKDEEVSTHPTSKSNKLLKNRISAQNSRMRKKKYIEQLQKNQKILIIQLQQTEKEIQKAKEQLNLILTKSKQNDSFNHDEKPTYERLKYLLRSQQNLDEDEANMLIQLLINRVGVTCKQRKRMLDYYTKRLVNYSITAIYRYILQTSTENKGLLSKSNESLYEWDKQLYEKLELSQKQKCQLNKLKQKVIHQKKDWTDKINQFNQVRGQIAKTSATVEKEIMQLKYLFNTRQTAQIIISVQNRKYNQEISLQKDYDPFPRKKIKY